MKRLRDGGVVLGLFALLLSQAGCADTPLLGGSGAQSAALPGGSGDKELSPRQAMQASSAVAENLDKNGDAVGAIEQYERVVALDPNNLHACRRLAVLYDCVNQADKAESFYEKLAKATPRDASLYNDWGRHYYGANNFKEAESKFRTALKLDANLTLARKHLVLLEVNLLHSVDAMQLIVLQRRKNWNLAQLRKQLLAYLVCGVVLDGLGIFGHWKNRLTAFQSVAKY